MNTIIRIFNACFIVLSLSACGSISFNNNASENVEDTLQVLDLLDQAIVAQESHDNVKAADLYHAMIGAGAKSPKSLNRYAVFLREQMQFKQAEAIYWRALEYSPNDASTHYNLAILYELYQGDFEKAKAHFQRYQSLQDSPDKKVAAWIRDLDRRLASQQVAKEKG